MKLFTKQTRGSHERSARHNHSETETSQQAASCSTPVQNQPCADKGLWRARREQAKQRGGISAIFLRMSSFYLFFKLRSCCFSDASQLTSSQGDLSDSCWEIRHEGVREMCWDRLSVLTPTHAEKTDTCSLLQLPGEGRTVAVPRDSPSWCASYEHPQQTAEFVPRIPGSPRNLLPT